MKRVPDDIKAKALELQMALAQASMAGDSQRAKQLSEEYEVLMERMTNAVHGKRQRDPGTMVEKLSKSGGFEDFGKGATPWRVGGLCLCDAIYHGEAQVFDRPMVVTSLSYRLNDDDMIDLLLLRGKNLAIEKKIGHIGSVSADSGSMLILNSSIKDRQTSEALKQTIRSSHDGARVKAVTVDAVSGWMVSPGFGSGGFDVYAKAGLIVIDFLRIRDDPELMRY